MEIREEFLTGIPQMSQIERRGKVGDWNKDWIDYLDWMQAEFLWGFCSVVAAVWEIIYYGVVIGNSGGGHNEDTGFHRVGR